ncbi:hypothetical protein D778_00139 [Xanthomarina gelatinilytica]|uniref:Uncharacterized protein n=1 Tax=Xanthomarina gelatinilytica TaxID=1137281 RepID=M7MFX4_9FLAO|nr:hypothetical protein D778_00139 [Xanthomarina gelatinilytica]
MVDSFFQIQKYYFTEYKINCIFERLTDFLKQLKKNIIT